MTYEELKAENELLKSVIAWANNSLYGSHGFFLSLNGGEPNVHHLDEGIEEIKSLRRKDYRDGLHLNILAEAMAEVKATSDGLSDQPIAAIVAGCIDEIKELKGE